MNLHASASKMAADTTGQNFEILRRRLAFAEELEKPSSIVSKSRTETVIRETMAANPDFLLIAVIDRKGREIFKVGTQRLVRKYGVLDLSADPVFLRAKQTKEVALSDFDSLWGVPVAAVAVPLKDGRYAFIIAGFSGLWEHIREQRIGVTGRVFFSDPYGRLFRFADDAPLPADADVIKEMLYSGRDRCEYISARDGVFVGAFKKVRGFNLFVVTLQRRDEAFWFIRFTTSLLIFFLLAIATASYFAALSASRRLVRPIMELSEGARRVSLNNFSMPVDEKSGFGEFAGLVKAFNDMMAEMKKYHGIQLDAVLQEKEKTDLLIKLMNDGLILADMEGKVSYANASAMDALSGPPEQAGDDSSSRRRSMAVFARDMAKRRPQSEIIELDTFDSAQIPPSKAGEEALRSINPERGQIPSASRRVDTADGRRRFFRVSAQVFSEGKNEPGVFIVMRDITLERRLDLMKEDFFHSVAHDLRAPVLGMQGYLKLLENSCSAMPKEGEYVSALQRQSGRLFSLIEDVLDMAMMEAGSVRLRVSKINPEEFLRLCAEPFLPSFEEKGVKLEIDTKVKESFFEGDAALLERVVNNLLSNALKFSPSGGRVAAAYSSADEYAHVTVSDTGPGIPEDKKKFIFDKFKQLDAAAVTSENNKSGNFANKGFGLGLAICKKIIELHGGLIWVESVFGKGSRFIFKIPIKMAEGRREMVDGK